MPPVLQSLSIRQHTSAYVSIRQRTSAYVIIRQHTSAYVSIRQHTSAYVSIRQHTSAYVSADSVEKGAVVTHNRDDSRPSNRGVLQGTRFTLLYWYKSTNTDWKTRDIRAQYALGTRDDVC